MRRRFPNVCGGLVSVPATYPSPGTVNIGAAPTFGIFDIWRFPQGVDETAMALAAAFDAARWSSYAVPGIMRWKYARLLDNLSNARQIVIGLEYRDRQARTRRRHRRARSSRDRYRNDLRDARAMSLLTHQSPDRWARQSRRVDVAKRHNGRWERRDGLPERRDLDARKVLSGPPLVRTRCCRSTPATSSPDRGRWDPSRSRTFPTGSTEE